MSHRSSLSSRRDTASSSSGPWITRATSRSAAGLSSARGTGPAITRSAASAAKRDSRIASTAASTPRLAMLRARLAAAPPSAAPNLKASSGPLISSRPSSQRATPLARVPTPPFDAGTLTCRRGWSLRSSAGPMTTIAQDTEAPAQTVPARAPLSPAERADLGKAARAETPRSSHAEWTPASDRPDPIALLEEQAKTRVQELLPIRNGRMAASPFTFYRGAAYVMAADLTHGPTTGLRAQLCVDAHLSNFGGFASPERDLLFDLNDFDETLPGPWEWDVKRLATSIAVAARANGFGSKRSAELVRGTVAEYRQAIRRFAGMTGLEVWYSRLDAREV